MKKKYIKLDWLVNEINKVLPYCKKLSKKNGLDLDFILYQFITESINSEYGIDDSEWNLQIRIQFQKSLLRIGHISPQIYNDRLLFFKSN